MSGEAMVVLWGAMKSVVTQGSKVLAVCNGLYGEGFGEIAQMLGAEVKLVSGEWNAVPDVDVVARIADEWKPALITAVHCETPSGTLNPSIGQIGAIARSCGALFLVDAVSSAGATVVDVDEWNIDLGLFGSQKALSLLPSLGIATVSSRAWKVIDEVKYFGYDAFSPWQGAAAKRYFPYTHDWRAIAALNHTLHSILSSGLNSYIEQHSAAAQYCRQRIIAMGLRLYPISDSISSPSCTAVWVPEGVSFSSLNSRFRAHGLEVGGNYAKLQGKVFRIGHMGSQANLELMRRACDVIQMVLSEQSGRVDQCPQ